MPRQATNASHSAPDSENKLHRTQSSTYTATPAASQVGRLTPHTPSDMLALQRSVGNRAVSRMLQRSPAAQQVIQRDKTTVPEQDVEPDYLLQEAREYEKRLGFYGYNHGKAQTAASSMVDKMIGSLIHDFDEHNVEHQNKLATTFGSAAKQYAGNVGTQFADVWAAMKTGNLRERMTALYNAAFGPLKTYALDAMQRDSWDELEARGFDKTKMQRRKKQLKWNVGAKDLYRDPGNPFDRKKILNYEHVGTTRSERAKNNPDRLTKRTVSDLEQGPFKAGLSSREKSFMFSDQFHGKISDDDIKDEKLTWEEGGTRFTPNLDNKWVKKIQNELHMPVVAGPSGTMLRMFQAWEFLKKPISSADYRLAVMSWMLVENDHSFHEMMLTAANYGLPYTPGQKAYRKVLPLSEADLRANVCKDGMFPDELAYVKKMQDGKFLSSLSSEAQQPLKQTGQNLGLSHAQALAINMYTGPSYLVQNPTLKGAGLSTTFQIDQLKKKKQALAGTATSELIAQAQQHNEVLQEALQQLPNYTGEVWRGAGYIMPLSYKKGSTLTFGSGFISSSKKQSKAEFFANKTNKPYRVVFKITSKTGKDISSLSRLKTEEEVLFKPGTKFVVTKRENTATNGGRLEVEATEQ